MVAGTKVLLPLFHLHSHLLCRAVENWELIPCAASFLGHSASKGAVLCGSHDLLLNWLLTLPCVSLNVAIVKVPCYWSFVLCFFYSFSQWRKCVRCGSGMYLHNRQLLCVSKFGLVKCTSIAFFFSFWLCHVTGGIPWPGIKPPSPVPWFFFDHLVCGIPWPGIEPGTPEVKAWSPNPCTSREIPPHTFSDFESLEPAHGLAWRGCPLSVCRIRIFKQASFCHGLLFFQSSIDFQWLFLCWCVFGEKRKKKLFEWILNLGLARILGSWNESQNFPISPGTWLNERARRSHLELSPFSGLKSWAVQEPPESTSLPLVFGYLSFPAKFPLRHVRALLFEGSLSSI